MEQIETSDLVAFSHLRWSFVYQRPQHLMARFAKHRRVFFVEPAMIGAHHAPYLHIKESKESVKVLVPYLPAFLREEERIEKTQVMLSEFLEDFEVSDFTAWYYNPMALMTTHHLNPSVVVFDCMDELTGFKDCPVLAMKYWEEQLFRRADVVFTGGHALYEAKKARHHNIHAYPSSIDHAHFHRARTEKLAEPQDQVSIPGPRIGFYGVIEERIDLKLLSEVALLRPAYQFIMIGPVIRMNESELPRLKNIHYLGMKDYDDLPHYLSKWNCAMMPFALNDSTRYISPTKTPEFLAGGKQVVSTAVNDVVYPYAQPEGLVHIATTPEHFAECVDLALENEHNEEWLKKVDQFLGQTSWDETFLSMALKESKVRTFNLSMAKTSIQKASRVGSEISVRDESSSL